MVIGGSKHMRSARQERERHKTHSGTTVSSTSILSPSAKLSSSLASPTTSYRAVTRGVAPRVAVSFARALARRGGGTMEGRLRGCALVRRRAADARAALRTFGAAGALPALPVSDIVKYVRGSESNCQHDSRKM
jgi:hypothetical protein